MARESAAVLAVGLGFLIAAQSRANGELAWRAVHTNWQVANDRFPANTIVRMIDSVKGLTTAGIVALDRGEVALYKRFDTIWQQRSSFTFPATVSGTRRARLTKASVKPRRT